MKSVDDFALAPVPGAGRGWSSLSRSSIARRESPPRRRGARFSASRRDHHRVLVSTRSNRAVCVVMLIAIFAREGVVVSTKTTRRTTRRTTSRSSASSVARRGDGSVDDGPFRVRLFQACEVEAETIERGDSIIIHAVR